MKIKTMMLLSVFLSAHSFAGTATEKVEAYFNELRQKNFSATASYFVPGQMTEFRDMMSFYKELPEAAQLQILRQFFGPEATTDSINKLSDAQFYASFMNFVLKQADATGALDFEQLEILGEINEGDDKVHVVTRNKLSVGEIEIEQMEVISLQKSDGEWKLLLSGKIKGIPNQIRAALAGNGS